MVQTPRREKPGLSLTFRSYTQKALAWANALRPEESSGQSLRSKSVGIELKTPEISIVVAYLALIMGYRGIEIIFRK